MEYPYLEADIKLYIVYVGDYEDERYLGKFLSESLAQDCVAKYNYGDFDSWDAAERRIEDLDSYKAKVREETLTVNIDSTNKKEREIFHLPYTYFELKEDTIEEFRYVSVAVPKGFILKITPVPYLEGKFLIIGKTKETIEGYINNITPSFYDFLKVLTAPFEIVNGLEVEGMKD